MVVSAFLGSDDSIGYLNRLCRLFLSRDSSLSDEERLDILVNNAGVMCSRRQETQDGFEMDFGVNHLGEN